MFDDIATSDWQAADAALHLHPFSDHKTPHQERGRILDGMAVLSCVAVGYGGQMGPEEFGRYAARQLEEKIKEIGDKPGSAAPKLPIGWSADVEYDTYLKNA